jgi:HAD superfamily hydrolase (TIGR01450 family)
VSLPSFPGMAWLLDLDGVVWLAGVPVPGSVEAVARLRAAGERVVFVTNNSSAPVGEQEGRLAAIGVPAAGDVVTSAGAAAALLEPGSRAYAAGGPGVVEALEARGIVVVDATAPEVDAVVVGFHRSFDYEGLRLASGFVRAGARLIGTNDDPTYPTPTGEIPGGGAILAAVACAAGVEPDVAGKPFEAMAGAVRALAGHGPHVVVGDRPSTDGAFARRLGARFALVLSGVTRADDLPFSPTPDVVGDDLAAVVDLLLR